MLFVYLICLFCRTFSYLNSEDHTELFIKDDNLDGIPHYYSSCHTRFISSSPRVIILGIEEYASLVRRLPSQVLQHAFEWFLPELKPMEVSHWQKSGFFVLQLSIDLCLYYDCGVRSLCPRYYSCCHQKVAEINFLANNYSVLFLRSNDQNRECIIDPVPSQIHDLRCSPFYPGYTSIVRNTSIDASENLSKRYKTLEGKASILAARHLLIGAYEKQMGFMLYKYARFKLWYPSYYLSPNESMRRNHSCFLLKKHFSSKLKPREWSWIFGTDERIIRQMTKKMFRFCVAEVFGFSIYWNPSWIEQTLKWHQSILRIGWLAEELQILLNSEPINVYIDSTGLYLKRF